MKKHILFLIAIITSLAAHSQSSNTESMHESGKVYVFLGVVLIILIGLFVYLFILDRKIKKLEKDNK